ncbi:MAG: hypothetical protein WAM94_11945 [Chromatiaceae bacterium]
MTGELAIGAEVRWVAQVRVLTQGLDVSDDGLRQTAGALVGVTADQLAESAPPVQ